MDNGDELDDEEVSGDKSKDSRILKNVSSKSTPASVLNKWTLNGCTARSSWILHLSLISS